MTCASRSANSSGVPSNADIESLSKTASDARGRELGHDLEPGRVAQERRDDLLDSILALPGHRDAQLGDPHQLRGQRHVPGEEDPDAGPAGRLEHPPHALGHLRAVGELADDADLHVVDDQRDAIRVADVGEGVGNQKVAAVLHGASFRAGPRGYLATVVVRS